MKVNSKVMVRDVKTGFWDDWYEAQVVQVRDQDIVLVKYRDGNGIIRKIYSSKLNAILKPLECDVATVLDFGPKALGFLKDFH